MQLTLFSDYSLRLLIYLAANPDRLVPVGEVARAYRVSHHLLVKIVQVLVQKGIIESVKGRRGGLRLNKLPDKINLGELVRLTEPTLNLVECFDTARNTCPIAPICGLKHTLLEARRAFLAVLDQSTVADFVADRPQLLRLWKPPRARGTTRP
jgi:Rrf2 family transcriptional regulator, nitric oxide-sensitive transcriptional repressor